VDITVVGAGHVGLVSAACFAAVGHHVRVQDLDAGRIEQLHAGEAPFFEPGLDELLALVRDRVSFHVDAAEAVPGAALIFLCVDTPNGPDGRVDLTSVVGATTATARHAGADAVIVNRSTAPVGTAAYIRSLVEGERGSSLPVAVNPEFLAEGVALRGFLAPDRVVVGTRDDQGLARVVEAYEPILSRRLPDDLPHGIGQPRSGPDRVPLVTTDPATAELIKYASNAFLAMKISFINEMSGIAEELGGDITQVALAVGLDRRIGPAFLGAGIGWGGSCFPKDIVALQGMAETRGLAAKMIRAANEVNAEQHRWAIRKLHRHLRTLVGRRVGLLGLAYKPNTDDLRNAPAVEIATELARHNVRVAAFDPAVKSLSPELEAVIHLEQDPIALARGAEALVLVTEWPSFRQLDWGQLRAVMKHPLILDGRNFLDPTIIRAAGFTYEGVGR
jgi:UDPglucose 6-dehydrogenase